VNALTTLFWLGVTIGAYRLSLEVRKRSASPLTTPIVVSTAVVIAALPATHATLQQYEPAKAIITMFLGPATVALAIPLFRNRGLLGKHAVPALAALAAGSLSTMVIAALMARAWGFAPELASSIAVKSATTPIAIEIAKIVHGDPALAAVFAVSTGMLGAAFGPWFLDRMRVTDPVARGVAFGTISHGIGTAQAAAESELSGAIAGAAIGLAGVMTALLAPHILPLLIR
jgi:predicted murein hydrolase (TIGR00659 family)